MEVMADIESESLPAHVSLCQQRYHHLDLRIQQIERRIEKIEELVIDIHQKIDQLNQKQNEKWDKGQVAVIGLLLGVCGYLLTKGFFN